MRLVGGPSAMMRGIGLCMFVVSLFAATTAYAQQQDKLLAEVGLLGSLLDEAPFDIITLKQEAGGRSVRVNPIDFPNRRIPTSPQDTDRIRVTFPFLPPDRIYEVLWKDIDKVYLYEQLVLQQANKLLEQKNFSEAFEHLNFLKERYPQTPGLKGLRREFLYRSAIDMASSRKLPHALGVLEEFLRMFPDDKQRDQIRNAISNVANQLISSYFAQNDLATAKAMIQRLEKDYSKDPLPAVADWKKKFHNMASDLHDKSVQLRDSGDFVQARQAAVKMLDVEPEFPDGKRLLNDLIRAYPIVRVGVFQFSSHPDASALADWPAFRSGQLLTKPLFEFRNTGPEGGVYRFGFGSFIASDDRKSLTLMIQNAGRDGIPDSLAISQEILDRARVGHSTYVPGWASILDKVSVSGPDKLELQMRRPHVLPQAFLQWQLRRGQSATKALYRLKSEEPNLKRYEWAGDTEPADYQPREIHEILYTDPKKATNDLMRGEIEIIDRLFPADVSNLKNAKGVSTEPYALPTVHMLIPKTSNPYMDDREFRRALIYAINRNGILEGEILGGSTSRLTRVVSGPFPVGLSDTDPIAYAYNSSVEVIPYDPRVAKVLVMLTKAKLKNMAEKKHEALPPLPTIKLGVPNYESARVAGEAIIQAWKLIDVPAELVVLDEMPAASVKPYPVDFLYVSAAVWEPATDAERLFGIGGPAESNNQFIVQALGRLNSARNWVEVRQGCQDLHALVSSHLPILPLWQVGETYAYRSEAAGISKKPIGLYQDVQKWRYQAR